MLSGPAAGLLGFGAAIALIGLGVPVAVAMGVVGAVGFYILNGWSGVAFILGSTPFEAIFPYSLSVVPLFIMMGVFAAQAGLSRALFQAVNVFVGHLRGGLAIATIGACALFGAICGSSLATAATMGRVAIPEMRRYGYADSLASASVAAGGTLGVLIPPSILLVLYGLLTETSIGKLFIGALIPGLLGTLLYMLAVLVQTWIRPALAPPGERARRADLWASLRSVWSVLLLFVLVIGGMYLGWFSPTEGAAVGAFGTFLLSLANGGLSRSTFGPVIRETAATTGMIFLILIGAALFNFFLESTRLPDAIVSLVEGAGLSSLGTLLLLFLLYLVLGCFMDSLSMILVTTPLVFPIVIAAGYDPVWFGIFLVTAAEIALITPPVGMNLFVIQGVTPGLEQRTIISGILPFIFADVVRTALLIAVPSLVLWLPAHMEI